MPHQALINEIAAFKHSAAHVGLLQHLVFCICTCDVLWAKPNVQHPQATYKLLVVFKKHGQLLLLQRQCEVRFHDVRLHIVRIVLGHQPRRQVDAHHLGRRLVDVFHQRGKAAGKCLVQSGTEKSVNHHRFGRQFRRVEVHHNLRKGLDALTIHHPLLVRGAVVRQFTVNVEEKHRHLIASLGHQTGHSQRIAAVVSWASKHHERRSVVPFFSQDAHNGLGRTFHQVDACHGLVFNRKLV